LIAAGVQSALYVDTTVSASTTYYSKIVAVSLSKELAATASLAAVST
jgi:hypothetical protein